MAAETVDFEIKVNTGNAPSDVAKVGASFKKLESDAESLNSKGLGPVSRFSEETTRRLSGLSNIAGDVVGSVGKLSPELAKAAGALTSVAGSAIQTGSALGPVGFGVGALTAALPYLVGALADAGRETNSFTMALGAMGTNLDAAISKLRELRREQARSARFASGDVTEEEASAEAGRRRVDLVENERRFAERLRRLGGVDLPDMGFGEGLVGGLGAETADRMMRAVRSGDRSRFERELSAAGIERDDDRRSGLLSGFDDLVNRRREMTAALDQQAEAQENLNGLMQEEMEDAQRAIELQAENDRRRRGGGGNANRDAERAEERSFRDLIRSIAGTGGETIDSLAADEESAMRFEEISREQQRAAEVLLDSQNMLNDARREGMRLESESGRLQRENAEDQKRRADEARMVSAKAAEDAINLAEQGAEVVAEAFNLQEGPKAAISAALEVARAVSDFASFNYVGGAGHLLSASLFGIQAAKMGFSSDSGSGVARPTAPTNSSVGGTSGGNVTINYNAPVAEALIGREQRRAQREADLQFARG